MQILMLISFFLLSLQTPSVQQQTPPAQQTQPAQQQTPPPGPSQHEAQQPHPGTQTPGDETVRINTALVQSDVMVFDKTGKFVEGLEPDDLKLFVNGKPRPISFFDLVRTGSGSEESQVAVSRGENAPRSPAGQVHRRAIIFFIDDLHLSADSLSRTRKALLLFINENMLPSDQVLIASTSGTIGFLQQFTSDAGVLRAAVARLSYHPSTIRDFQRPPISAYLAQQIEQNNTSVINLLTQMVGQQTVGAKNPRAAAFDISERARAIMEQVRELTDLTFVSFANLLDSASFVPGLKLALFISDGFLLDPENAKELERYRRLTTAAAKSGAVIYTFDARGLVTDSPDAGSEEPVDVTGQLSRETQGETTALQDSLRSMAADTGGRALLNNNSLPGSLQSALSETGRYYVISWRLPEEDQKNARSRRIELKIPGHPELTVRFRRVVFDPREEVKARKPAQPIQNVPVTPAPAQDLTPALTSPSFPGDLPITLVLSYAKGSGKKTLLTISARLRVDDSPGGDPRERAFDVQAMVLNDQGQIGSNLKDRLPVKKSSEKADAPLERSVSYHREVRLPPGLYQVRIAARDVKSEVTGGAREWINIPDLSSGQLALGSLSIGELPSSSSTGAASSRNAAFVSASLDRHLHKGSRLRIVTHIYNAARAPGANQCDLSIGAKILKDGQEFKIISPLKVPTGVSDSEHTPYGIEIPSGMLPAGDYSVQLTVKDNIAQKSASGSIAFEIE